MMCLSLTVEKKLGYKTNLSLTESMSDYARDSNKKCRIDTP